MKASLLASAVAVEPWLLHARLLRLLMFCQHLFELRLGNALNLAQQFMRYLTNPKPAPQLICQVRHQTGSHLGIWYLVQFKVVLFAVRN